MFAISKSNKNKMKKIMFAIILAMVSATCFGCNKNQDDSADAPAEPTETLSLADVKQPLTFSHGNGSNSDAKEPAEDATEGAENSDANSDSSAGTDSGSDSQDASKSSLETSPEKTVDVTEHVDVTDASGQPVTDAAGVVQTEIVKVTEQVQVTDPAGQPVTDSAGTVQTEVVNVTEKTTAPAGGEETPTQAVVNYTPEMDICNAYWLDMSQESDFFFDGEFLSLEFQVNEGIPDGSYPVTLKKTDIASWDVIKWDPVCIDGEVAVNSDVAPQDDFPADDFALKVNSVSAKPGDIVKVTVDLKNNPGFCGFVIELEYDKSALTIVSTESGADFDNAISYVTN